MKQKRARRPAPLSPQSGERYGEGLVALPRRLRITDQPLTVPLPASLRSAGRGASTPRFFIERDATLHSPESVSNRSLSH